ncbi:MAG: GlpG protein [Pseudohongiellaceae bacterium]|jgi:GlpG protein
MIKIARVPVESDLSAFSSWLNSQGLAHRITEELGEQAIFLENEGQEQQVNDALQLYLTDEAFKLQLDSVPKKHFLTYQIEVLYPRALPSQAPLVYAFMLLSIIFALLTDFGQGGPILRAFLILDPLSLSSEGLVIDLNTLYGRIQGLWITLRQGELWRLISPGFIHFNVMHITFNLLMLWLLGGQLEIQKGSIAFLSLALFVSAISNVAQLFETSYLFGGLSGVVYGLVGYCWLWKHYEPEIFFPDILMKFSIVWLILGYTPVTEWLGWGRMANAAHLYGLISGLVWGGLMIALKTMKGKKDPG